MAIAFGPKKYESGSAEVSTVEVTTVGGDKARLTKKAVLNDNGEVEFSVKEPGTYVIKVSDADGNSASYVEDIYGEDGPPTDGPAIPPDVDGVSTPIT